MSRRSMTLLGIIASLAILTLIFVFPNLDSNTISKPEALKPQQEQKVKLQIRQKDITSTDLLSRTDAQRHISTLVNKLDNANPKQITSHVEQLLKSHDHILSITWYDFTHHKQYPYTTKNMNLITNKQAKLNNYLNIAKNKISYRQSYESPSFEEKGQQYFVIAKPSSKGTAGVVVVMNQRILDEVKKHQDKNLRLIPYPKEGNYRVESVHTDTLRDIKVKTGHDNEKASHYYENEIVVHFREPISDKELVKISTAIRSTWVRKMGYAYVFHSSDMDYRKLQAYFMSKYKPKYVEPHYLYLTNDVLDKQNPNTSSNIPNDLLYSKYQWNLPAIETGKGWDISKGSEDVIIAVVDTGVEADHPDLQGVLAPGYNVIDPASPPEDDVGHGTHVTGIIAASVNNNEGVAGISWFNKVMPVKALDNSGAGTTYSVSEGIIWAADHGAKVINMSLGNYADSEFLHDAVKYAYDRDIVLIAATGNDNTERPGYPAAYPEVFSVSATDANMQRASFSNYGDYVDVVAPGESIASTYMGKQYASLSGTSMATPHVAALAGLIRSRNPKLTNVEVMDLMRNSVVDLGTSGHDKYYGYGQIDIYKALQAAGNGEASLQFWPQHVQSQLQSVIRKKQVAH
ncbi:subtilisin family serine protease [Paenibacillus sp. DS2015]|uniref:S8 family peptidase n=1 Tax=Paenibacillus sp. DS2015 TaxID=3373917 RepID=UPI003D24CCA0